MSLHRFYTERKNVREGSSVKLADQEIHHIRNVLRLQKGDPIIVFNGEKEFTAKLRLVSRDVIIAELIELQQEADFRPESKVEITLFQSLIQPSQFETALQKTVELGVDNIVPMSTEFSQKKLKGLDKKIDRWKKIVLSACKQSERLTVPELLMPVNFEDIEKAVSEFDEVYFLTIPRDNIPPSMSAQEFNIERIIEKKEKVEHIAYLIGPEGGFSPKEHELAKDLGFEFIKFGENILRSETASIAVLSVLMFLFS